MSTVVVYWNGSDAVLSGRVLQIEHVYRQYWLTVIKDNIENAQRQEPRRTKKKKIYAILIYFGWPRKVVFVYTKMNYNNPDNF